jgi:hypothetical protein
MPRMVVVDLSNCYGTQLGMPKIGSEGGTEGWDITKADYSNNVCAGTEENNFIVYLWISVMKQCRCCLECRIR